MAELLAPFAGEDAIELAGMMIGRFGSLQRMLEAPLPQLRDAAAGYEEAVSAIAGVRALVEAAMAEELAGARLDGANPALHDYLRARIGTASEERLHVIWCDMRRGYLADETLAVGSRTRIECRIRPLVERALALGAAGFLLAHNHPSGDCRPSAEDIAATYRIRTLADALELELVDHLVVTRCRVFSMRLSGYL